MAAQKRKPIQAQYKVDDPTDKQYLEYFEDFCKRYGLNSKEALDHAIIALSEKEQAGISFQPHSTDKLLMKQFLELLDKFNKLHATMQNLVGNIATGAVIQPHQMQQAQDALTEFNDFQISTIDGYNLHDFGDDE